MAVGFGFSVSDVCNAFKLAKASIHSLDEQRGAAPQYVGLLSEIELLQIGLEEIESLLLDNERPQRQHQALQNAVVACQKSIDDFLETTAKYQPHFTGTKSHSIGTRLRKVQWALCRTEDVEKFKTELERNVSSINMLLLTLQARREQSQAITCRDDDKTKSSLDSMMTTMTLEQRQLFSMMFQQNQELLRSVHDLRTMMATHYAIPPQILLQQPVIFLDPLGKIAPFHLDFIDSLDCFHAVMRSRFEKAGVSASGLEKLTDGEYTIQDTDRKRPIDITRHWSNVFLPGQQVDMRMRYHRFACEQDKCPACLSFNDHGDEDAYWLVYELLRNLHRTFPRIFVF